MRIAIASGKGGTGKTIVSTNLASVAVQNGRVVAYVDCDVEEPNGHVFLNPQVTSRQSILRAVPQVDSDVCVLCDECSEICQYSAIVRVSRKVLVYPELCHACGGCTRVCPEDAISKTMLPIGELQVGSSGALRFAGGTLNVGEHMSPPAIRAVKKATPEADVVLLDSPPGTSCPAVEAVRDCDLAVLVTEPTPFGLNDLKLAVEMVRALKIPLGIIVNRAGPRNNGVHEYCGRAGLPVFGEIPDDRAVAEAYSRGELACQTVPTYRTRIEDILDTILAAAEQ
jgi:MinD superfamily P-loop ATPase